MKGGDYRPRDHVNSTLLKTKPRRIASSRCLHTWHSRTALLTPPRHHQCGLLLCPPLLSPVIVVAHNHHHRHQHPPSPCLLLHPSIVVRSSSSFPHFPLGSSSPSPSPSSSYLHRILFDCCVLPVIVVVRPRVVSLLLLKILASTGATLLSPHRRLSILSALAILSI